MNPSTPSTPPPPLLLAPPRLAGLLPAQAASLHADLPSFIYTNPRLADLAPSEQDRLSQAMHRLLDISTAYLLHETTDATLHAAEVLFHRAVAEHAPSAPRTPAQYNAEMDAEVLDWWLSTTASVAAAREQAEHELALWRRQREARAS